MAKVTELIDEEEGERLIAEARHDDLISALTVLANRPSDNKHLEQLAKQSATLLDMLSKKQFSTDIRPLLMELTATLKVTNEMLKSHGVRHHATFTISRNKLGLIERIEMNENEGKGH